MNSEVEIFVSVSLVSDSVILTEAASPTLCNIKVASSRIILLSPLYSGKKYMHLCGDVTENHNVTVSWPKG